MMKNNSLSAPGTHSWQSPSLILMALILLLSIPLHTNAEEPVELSWEALIPEGWNPQSPLDQFNDDQFNQLSDSSPEAAKLLEEINEFNAGAPVVAELDGKVVKLPGFVVPLEFFDNQLSEFLLVPYFGACIHVPPPPANQVVYVKSDKPLDVGGMFDAVWVTGKMATTGTDNALAETGYTMQAYELEPYK